MPTYVYECIFDGKRREFVRPIGKRDAKVLCECGKRMFRRRVPDRVAVVGHAKHEHFAPMKDRIRKALHQKEQDQTMNRMRHSPQTFAKIWGN